MNDQPIEANFIVTENRGKQNSLECPRCGCEFDIDIDTEENLVWSWRKMAWLAECPLCGTQQE